MSAEILDVSVYTNNMSVVCTPEYTSTEYRSTEDVSMMHSGYAIDHAATN